MASVTTKLEPSQPGTDRCSPLFDDWFDPIETGIRERVRDLIEAMIISELDAALARPRYGRRAEDVAGGAMAGVAGIGMGAPGH